ncbi:methylmalonyl Co-A mutase-associated GTPase MeaB [Desulfatitalea tepidiphila]|uniref:methylmalonyl Co-A mutase-associated GTPase MeaB n=1 Tax=Desulfatitalea tepidiphila TaxID=1185843 RepID=UPI0006B63F4C|nr:methylmalonyl Co-A mutase-associated GTPase MeaB [Desulfatitalea tepidiphila]
MAAESLNYYLDGIASGDRRVLAKAITLVESRLAAHRDLAHRLIEEVMPRSGNAVRLGITGVPGVGKSTFIENFGMHIIDRGHRLAVLAVDPSSQRSGGSILADKTRMERLAASPSAFIRPSPSGGTLGGVARMTRESMLVCEAAGFDVVIVETVGVGQSESTVASMVDFFLLLMITGAGDALQGIKKGILELAHAVAINKADGANLELAEKTRRELASAMHLMQPTTATWTPPVVTCSALSQTGLDAIWEIIQDHRTRTMASGELQDRRKEQALQWMWDLIEAGLKDRFFRHPAVGERLGDLSARVRQGRMTPTRAAGELLFLLDNEGADNKGM